MSNLNNNEKDHKLSEFPFPLTNGPEESVYLTWLRNHSNYMATRGFLDYFRMAGVLIRGVLLNFLILLSLLLIISAVIGHLYGPQLRSLADMTHELSLKNSTQLAKQLKTKPRNIDKWIVGQLSEQTKNLLENDFQGNEFEIALSHEFRKIIDGELIYDPERFKGIKLQPNKTGLIRELIDQKIEDKDKVIKQICSKGSIGYWKIVGESSFLRSNSCLRRLNRLLMKEAYPEINQLRIFGKEIKKTTKSDATELSKGVVPCENENPVDECLFKHIRELTTPGSGKLEESHGVPMPVPFTITLWVGLIALLWCLLSPIYVLVSEIAVHNKSIERTSSRSSVNQRDRFERQFGMALLFVLVFALFEALPLLVDKFHQFLVSPDSNWNNIFASMIGVSVAILSGASKLISVFAGAKKKLVMFLIGLLGVFLPFLVILYVTEFLVYRPAIDGLLNIVLYIVPIVFILLIVVVVVVGTLHKSFKWAEYLFLFTLAAIIAIGMYYSEQLLAVVLTEEYTATGENHYFVLFLAVEAYLFCWLFVDVNRTSIHSLYRDRLASAYLVGIENQDDISIEKDINLSDIGQHDDGSTAPYHLLNVCLNLQGSTDPNIRDRASDFFIFSKNFIGGKRTGYCRTELMEQVHPQMSLATAMAISAAAASPNMGRGTNPGFVAIMVILNIRLGYWLPNPGLLHKIQETKPKDTNVTGECRFEEVFEKELEDVEKRWKNVYQHPSNGRKLHSVNESPFKQCTTKHSLVGIGLSGGGIRSATINLGIVQALHKKGIFDHIDFMSSVSGGGYLGASISTLMRDKKGTGDAGIRKQETQIDADVSVSSSEVNKSKNSPKCYDTLWERFRWRVPPRALIREMLMKLDGRHKWINLSDGGHIENLAGIELLRRRCKFIIIGDGEADPDLTFNGLATLIRYAQIDLGIKIDIDVDKIRVENSEEAVYQGKDNLSKEHCAFGKIIYPSNKNINSDPEVGYLLYLKSSYTDDENEVIKEYRNQNPSFPHQSTADQFFDEQQFECYRALGQHIGEKACEELLMDNNSGLHSFDSFAAAMKAKTP
ncbi:hypothetical protein [Thalassotalea atypica]|uniref:hypothetical protein n=1 Tax=Thalassotalea atypica TaxID=2054316 RepID=UPI002572F059|nr:hypothetical protein [Thalassotalea atypica]